MCYPNLLNNIAISSVVLSLPREDAPSTKNRGANNCETIFFFGEISKYVNTGHYSAMSIPQSIMPGHDPSKQKGGIQTMSHEQYKLKHYH